MVQVVLISLLITYLVLLAAVQISQRITRTRAEHLLADIRGLQLERSSWSDAQVVMRHWGKWGSSEDPCDANHCVYEIHFADLAARVIMRINTSQRFACFFSRLAETAATALGAHLPYVEGGFHLQKMVVVGTYFSLATNVPFQGALISPVTGTRNLESYDLWPEKDPHPEYRTVLRTGTIGYFFTQFTAATKPADVEWLTSFNFSCITRWVPCKEMGDLRPSAWEKHIAEYEHISATRKKIAECAYPLEELVRASQNVVLVQVEKPNAQTPQFTTPARLLERLTGSGSWHAGEARNIWSESVASKQILLFAKDADPVVPHDCGVIPATPENLRIVKAAVEHAH